MEEKRLDEIVWLIDIDWFIDWTMDSLVVW